MPDGESQAERVAQIWSSYFTRRRVNFVRFEKMGVETRISTGENKDEAVYRTYLARGVASGRRR